FTDEFTITRGGRTPVRVTLDRAAAVRKADEPAVLVGHTGPVIGLAVAPDGAVLASGSRDGTVRLWDARTGQPRRTLAGHTTGLTWLAFSPDGRTLGGGAAESWEAVLWDVGTGEVRQRLPRQSGRVRSVAFSPDGTAVAVAYGGLDNTVKVW